MTTQERAEELQRQIVARDDLRLAHASLTLARKAIAKAVAVLDRADDQKQLAQALIGLADVEETIRRAEGEAATQAQKLAEEV